jgi:hypothetical protein
MRAARQASLSLAALAVAGALTALAGCKRTPPVEVGAIRVAQGALADPLREAGLDEDALERAAREALSGSGFPAGDVRAAHRARVDVLAVRLAPARGGVGPQAEVTVELALTPPEGAAAGFSARETGSGTAPVSGVSPARAWALALQSAARQAAEGLAVARAESAKPVEALIADLSSDDPRLRGHAVRALAERRDPAAVPALIGRLHDPDPEIVHRAVGALAQLRDERAVGPLIEVSRQGDPAITARTARIIADIGGREARGYLLTIEAGHADARVRRAAREALDELDAREHEAARVAAGQ